MIHQTQQRVLRGNQRVAGKIVSLFESHSQVIRKRQGPQDERVRATGAGDEVENGIVSGYQVLEGNAADTDSFLPAVKQHLSCFGRTPEMATADRGFFSVQNEREAKKLGVEKVAIPTRGRFHASGRSIRSNAGSAVPCAVAPASNAP